MSTQSMESFSLKNLAWVLILLFVWASGCMEEEKTGLLEFKAFLKSNGENIADDLLPSWVDNSVNECCRWERVVCDPSTGRVKKLLLSDIRQSQYRVELSSDMLYYENDKFWLLNVSIFLPFHELHHLNLSANSFDGFINTDGFKVFSNLKKLEVLDICGNEFDKSVLRSLGMLTSLKTLGLCSMGLHGLFPIQELADLKNLEVLDLKCNHLENFPVVQELYSLKSLVMLDLTDNYFTGFEDSNTSFIFENLETLKLFGNYFNNTSIQQLNAFTSLKSLSLHANNLEGFFPIQALHSLENLVTLDLSLNRLIGFEDSNTSFIFESLETLILDANFNFKNTSIQQLNIFTSLRRLSLAENGLEGVFAIQGLSNLEILDLRYNSFSGMVTSSMSSLKSVSLAHNNLNGSLSNQELCHLKKLQKLDLSWNFFQGIFPTCLRSLASLKFLDLSYNSFSGNLTSLLANLTSLEYIDLSNNLFEGSFRFSCLANHSNLQVIILGSENNKFSIDVEDLVGWVPLFQLKVLKLSNCKLDGLPNFLQYQFKLIVVDLSHNNLIEKFPNWLLEKNRRLECLILRNNSLIGQLLLQSFNPRIQALDISDNQFVGRFQGNLADMIPNIMSLNLSNNAFEGTLPSSIADFKYLRLLDMSTNNFFGEVPKKLFQAYKLELLKLSNNKFEGEIFLNGSNPTHLSFLYLDNNQFNGSLPKTIAQSFSLYFLDVSYNNMLGEIPSGICNMTSLQTLVLGNNGFKGRLPYDISQLWQLEFLDVSHNALSGYLPNLSAMKNLDHLHLQGNMFEGSIPNNFLNSSSSLLTLDIRDNMLFGRIPKSICALSKLRILLLGRNFLSDFIPSQLCHLTEISLMDLSHNSFYGPIPSCFGHIGFGDMRTRNKVFEPYFLDDRIYWSIIYEGDFDRYLSILMNYKRFEEDEVEFNTKYNSNSYRGGILDFMSGLDLSFNNLTGEIPYELGMLSWIHALNLSHNQLKGSIPKSFFNLSQIESLDLSYNQLSGQIPPELVELNFLSVFSVAHNNISGRVPDKAQFQTFGESSYKDNPFLCGQLLDRKCNMSPYSSLEPSRENKEKWYNFFDHVTFYASFATSYIIILLAFIIILYINPYWRRRWFFFIEECMYSCYYFACDICTKLVAYLRN